jgi:DNA-binding NarL/FixJ family response regulator
MAKILIVDDSEPIRHAIRSFLEASPPLEICGEAHDGADAIAAARRLHPDVVVLDLSMPVMNGLEAARELVNLRPRPAIIMFTAHDRSELSRDMESLGIKGVISKSDDRALERLRASVNEAAR